MADYLLIDNARHLVPLGDLDPVTSVALTDAGRRLHDEVFPQIAALNQAVLEAVDDAAVRQLDRLLRQLTAQARTINDQRVQDVRADRRAGGSRRVRPQR